nr:putative protein FAM157B isoform X1 [Homo sapiens]|eukprot:XP_011513966.1 putative protein FAM157B isoform X1 [Homo sapiens]
MPFLTLPPKETQVLRQGPPKCPHPLVACPAPEAPLSSLPPLEPTEAVLPSRHLGWESNRARLFWSLSPLYVTLKCALALGNIQLHQRTQVKEVAAQKPSEDIYKNRRRRRQQQQQQQQQQQLDLLFHQRIQISLWPCKQKRRKTEQHSHPFVKKAFRCTPVLKTPGSHALLCST